MPLAQYVYSNIDFERICVEDKSLQLSHRAFDSTWSRQNLTKKKKKREMFHTFFVQPSCMYIVKNPLLFAYAYTRLKYFFCFIFCSVHLSVFLLRNLWTLNLVNSWYISEKPHFLSILLYYKSACRFLFQICIRMVAFRLFLEFVELVCDEARLFPKRFFFCNVMFVVYANFQFVSRSSRGRFVRELSHMSVGCSRFLSAAYMTK